jgi:hypothetical protein
MHSPAVVSSVALALGLLGACGSDSNTPASSVGGPPGTPPGYIDIDVCAQITEATSLSFSGECSSCCANAGFTDSSSINADKCTCGNMPDSGGGTVCASQMSSSDACSTCCTNAGFLRNLWIGGTSCECNGKQNDSVCAGSTSDASVCAQCCLANGFLGYGFFGISTASCSCHGK